MGTIFVAGVYGVGKNTICEQLSSDLKIPFFSAGDLISKVNGEKYGANKAVSDKDKNQDILATEVQALLSHHTQILLAGHFCIFNSQCEIEPLPISMFEKLSITELLLLEADTDSIIRHLSSRDKREYTFQQIADLKKCEHDFAACVASLLGCPIHIHTMKFDGSDFASCRVFFQ